MYQIRVKDAKNGMVCAKDIYVNNQQLLPKGMVLTEKDIALLKFYEVDHIFIVKEWREMDESKTAEDLSDYLHAVMPSVSDDLKSGFNEIVSKNMMVDEAHILSMAEPLLGENVSTLKMFSAILRLKDMDNATFIHSMNVSMICRLFGRWLKFDERELGTLTLAGLLHDVGKLRIPKEIIQKPGSLTDEEYEIIKWHPVYGYELLKDENVDERVKEAALYHHERCDGTGYPKGLKLDEIPLFAKIVMIADVYDALTANRVYRHGLCPFDVIDIFETNGKKHFDPELNQLFLSRVSESYLHERVRLSDGREGKIIALNAERYAKPVVQIADACVDLSEEADLYIKMVLGK